MIDLVRSIILFFFIGMLLSEERKDFQSPYRDSFQYNQAGKIGDNPFPTNPMSDRAIGYLLQGKAQAAISNYGNIINWDEHHMGIWNGYSYLPSVAFLAGVPGIKYSNYFAWENLENVVYYEGLWPLLEVPITNYFAWQHLYFIDNLNVICLWMDPAQLVIPAFSR